MGGGRRSTMGGGPAMGVRWGPAIPSTALSLYTYFEQNLFKSWLSKLLQRLYHAQVIHFSHITS